ncbi:DUF2884 family protein [Flocculibacter collagenilyticus]|uniref:DUF2884 family protein n=1 Tax=Flocculibacter collagenilyticus TaxID=2744479 RepID=UPI0018F40C14|nr:DUF2884 family protein [Flocculibacter collagenilyticus]
MQAAFITCFSKLSLSLFILLTFFPSMALAGKCDVRLNYGLLINNDHIRVMVKDRTQLQINNDKQLFIKGEWIHLNEEDTEVLKQFSLGLRREVPEIVNIAMEGVDIGLRAIDYVVKGLSGGQSGAGIDEHFKEIKFKLKKKFNRTGEHFYIAPQGLDEVADFFEDELGEEIKNIVTRSLGSIMVAVGEAVKADRNSLESRTTDLSENMDRINDDIARSLQAKSRLLEKKAEQFCWRLKELDKYETKLQDHVPNLKSFDIVGVELDKMY